MAHPVHGQHEGRDERIRQTAAWLKATPVDYEGRPVAIPAEKPAFLRAAEICDFIRVSLGSGVACVQVSETDGEVIDQVRQQLSEDELQKVRFG